MPEQIIEFFAWLGVCAVIVAVLIVVGEWVERGR